MGLWLQSKIRLFFALCLLPLPTAGLIMSSGNEFGTLILLRHGESEWNKSNRFSGWLNIGLTAHGEAQARAAGETIRAHGLHVDECYTSELCRASDTLALCLQAAGIDGHDGSPIPPTHASWKLNERHYGALTGLRKDDVKATLGSVALAKYRRDFDTPPIPMLPTHPLFSAVYSTLTARGGGAPGYVENAPELAALPVAESLSNCHDRVQAYVQEHVHPALRAGKTVLVAAHNNVLRTLMVHLDNADPRGEHGSADIPKAVPIVYQLDRTTMQPKSQASISALGGFTGKQLCKELEPTATDDHERRAATFPAVSVEEVLTYAMVRDEAHKLGLSEADVPLLASSAHDSSLAAVGSAPPSGARPSSLSSGHRSAAVEDRHYSPWRSGPETGACTPPMPAFQSYSSTEP